MKKREFNPSYVGERNDIIKLIPSKTKNVLDVGCSNGTLGRQIKEKRTDTKVFGVELDESMAICAKKYLEDVIVGNLDELNLSDYLEDNYFDCIIFADILEHLRDPWNILKRISTLVSNDGVVIASIPNIRYYETIYNLVFKGYWPYRDRGIHDRTHLRYFTKKNILELFDSAGLRIESINRNYRVVDKQSWLNKFSPYCGIPIFKEFLTFQYLIVARKRG